MSGEIPVPASGALFRQAVQAKVPPARSFLTLAVGLLAIKNRAWQGWRCALPAGRINHRYGYLQTCPQFRDVSSILGGWHCAASRSSETGPRLTLGET